MNVRCVPSSMRTMSDSVVLETTTPDVEVECDVAAGRSTPVWDAVRPVVGS